MEAKPPDRFRKLEPLIRRERMLGEAATVIGVGAIGRQVALQLTALGVPKLQLIDFGRVASSHITLQGFLAEDVGAAKVDAVGGLCHRTEPMLDLEAICGRFRSSLGIGTAVFCCVKSSAVRAAVWNSVERRCAFWGDGRLRGERLRVLAATTEQERTRYSALVREKAPSRRGSQATTFTAAIVVASLLVRQYTRYLRGMPVEVDAALDLAAGKYVVAEQNA